MNTPVIDFVHTNRYYYVEELKGLLAIPSVSALPEHAGDVRRAAVQWVADAAAASASPTSASRTRPATPSSTASWRSARPARRPSSTTVTTTCSWRPRSTSGRAAFEPVVRDGEILRPRRRRRQGPGSSCTSRRSRRRWIKQTGGLPVNLKLLIEGEEEVGSRNLDAFIESHKDLLAADVVVISDTAMFDRGVPSICYGLRGLAYARSTSAAATPISTLVSSAVRSSTRRWHWPRSSRR